MRFRRIDYANFLFFKYFRIIVYLRAINKSLAIGINIVFIENEQTIKKLSDVGREWIKIQRPIFYCTTI